MVVPPFLCKWRSISIAQGGSGVIVNGTPELQMFQLLQDLILNIAVLWLTIGVPVICPVLLFTDNPAGRGGYVVKWFRFAWWVTATGEIGVIATPFVYVWVVSARLYETTGTAGPIPNVISNDWFLAQAYEDPINAGQETNHSR